MKVKELAELLGVTVQSIHDGLKSRRVVQQNGVATEVDEQTARSIVIGAAMRGNERAYNLMLTMQVTDNEIAREIIAGSNVDEEFRTRAIQNLVTPSRTLLQGEDKVATSPKTKPEKSRKRLTAPEAKDAMRDTVATYVPPIYTAKEVDKILTCFLRIIRSPNPLLVAGELVDVVLNARERKMGSPKIKDVEKAVADGECTLEPMDDGYLERLLQEWEEPNDWAWNLITSRSHERHSSTKASE